MGIYVNPGNRGFEEINDADYVDKTLLIDLINQTIDSRNKLTCVSRPRRFGKSYAARMLTAYYDCSCDSHVLFDDKKIARMKGYESHRNQYNVIYLEITSFISAARRQGLPLRDVPDSIVEAIQKELLAEGFEAEADQPLTENLLKIAESPNGKRFVFIIDEWDAMIREAKDDETAQTRYLDLLREWFKNSTFTPKAVAAAYMTGILPIKKDGSQSAISDFKEFTMVKPRKFAEFVGFTEAEVKALCHDRGMSYESMKRWYDGYTFKEVSSVYNPNSVMQAIENDDYDSYWTESSAAEALLEYIGQDYNGFTRTIAELVGGIDVKVNTKGFANDLTTFRGRDDVLTLMIHLGYLAYNSENGTAHIPNEEIKQEFQWSIHAVKHERTRIRIAESERLFMDTLQKNEKAVAEQIERIHTEETAAIHYNSESSLRSVIKLAYYTYRDHYLQFEELPAGEGYADIIYLPLPDSDWPALVIELKWNQSAKGAISQILDRKYPDVLKGLGRSVLLVGIAYNREEKTGKRKHTCKILELQAL